MNTTSNRDVTNSAHQIQMTTICRWMKPPHENFLLTPLFPSLPLPVYFINRSIWNSSQHYIITTVMRHSCVWPLCLRFIKVIVLAPSSVRFSTTAIYLFSCSLMYLCVPCYCHACFKSTALSVGMKTLYNTYNVSLKIDRKLMKNQRLDVGRHDPDAGKILQMTG